MYEQFIGYLSYSVDAFDFLFVGHARRYAVMLYSVYVAEKEVAISVVARSIKCVNAISILSV